MEKELAIKYLIKLSENQGEHNGRWEFEVFDDSSRRYCLDVKKIADNVGIGYPTGSDFKEEIAKIEKDDDCINALDEWTFELKCKIEAYLIKEILKN